MDSVLYYSNNLLKVKGILARLIRMTFDWSGGSRIRNKDAAKGLPLNTADYDRATNLFFFMAMEETYVAVQENKLLDLAPFRVTDPENVIHQGLWVTRGRIRKGIKAILGQTELPILMPTSRVAHLVMMEAHNQHHRGPKDTLWRSRSVAWIHRGKQLARKIERTCRKCIKDRKKTQTQRMADLPAEKFEICRPWTNVCLDLSGHIEVKAMTNVRSKMKAYPLVIACLNTGALAIQLMHNYSTAAFILQWEHFVAVRGRPKWVHSDPGSQLKKATDYVADKDTAKELDIVDLVESEARKGTTWKICPTQSQWQNGLAEQAVKGLKDTLRQVTMGNT